MTGASVIGAGADDVTVNFNWPFAAIIYDDFYTVTDDIYINSNGVIRFDAPLYSGAGRPPGYPTFPTNNSTFGQCISYGGNTDGHVTGNFVQKVTGAVGSRVLTIAFTYYTYYTGTTSHHADVQLRYYETNHYIVVDYSNVGGTTTPASHLAINAGDATWGGDYLASFPTQDTSFTFAPGATFDPPASITATAVSSNQINLSWTKNTTNSDVLLVYNTSNNFANPVLGQQYTVGSQILSGMGTVLYIGGSTSYTHSGLSPNTTYYYKIWSKLNSYNYYSGSGIVDSAETLPPVVPNAIITTNGPTTICQGDTVVLTSNTSPYYYYQWYKNSQLMVGENQLILNVLSSGSYSIVITNTISNLSDSSSSITVIVNSSTFNTNFSCSNTTLISPNTTAVITNATPNQNTFSFNWNLGDGSTFVGPSIPNNFHTYLSNGFFDVSLLATDTLTGCSETNVKYSYIYVGGIIEPCNPFIATITQPGYISYICPSDSFYLSANLGSNFSYQWMINGSPTPGDTLNYIYGKTGTYRVIIDYLPDTCPPKLSLPYALYQFPTNKPIIQHDSAFIPCTYDSLRYFVSNNNNFNSYLWSNNDSIQNSYYFNYSNVFVRAIDNNNCVTYSDSIMFNADSISAIPICIVTVDSTFSHNVIKWESPFQQNLDSVIIYREFSNQYYRIGSVSVFNTSEYHDFTSSPNSQEYSYKIQLKDSCGNLSSLSTYHKSILLGVSYGQSVYNLNWNEYEGAIISSYYLYRSTDSINYTFLDSVSSTLTTYKDPMSGNFYYALEANLKFPCNSSSKANTNYNVSRSNRTSNLFIGGISNTYKHNTEVTIIPNPTKGDFIIEIKNCTGENISMYIYNSIGKTVFVKKRIRCTGNTMSENINLANFPKGIYFVKIQTLNGVVVKKVVLQ